MAGSERFQMTGTVSASFQIIPSAFAENIFQINIDAERDGSKRGCNYMQLQQLHQYSINARLPYLPPHPRALS